jgi:hypothetical protein
MAIGRSTYGPAPEPGQRQLAPGSTRIEDLPASVLEFCAKVLEGKRTAMPETFQPEILATEVGRIQYAKAHARRELLNELGRGLRDIAAGASPEIIHERITQQPHATAGSSAPSA